jgi:cell fate regulator YaaT (PSP1 superfamily)
MKLVDVEQLLGGERIIFYYTSEDWVDFRELVRKLAAEYQTRIEMCQVNARNEARLVADYEKCGQHCCCKQFLKVLKPVSMRSAKVQKATLDPTKISGRCGRLMCCLRYEDKTYTELQKRLPKKQTPVETEDGIGVVIDSQILTQLVLVRLDDNPGALQAYPLENLTILKKEQVQARKEELEKKAAQQKEEAFRQKPREPRPEPEVQNKAPQPTVESQADSDESGEGDDQKKSRRRRRRRKPRGEGGDAATQTSSDAGSDNDDSAPQAQASGEQDGADGDAPRKKRRRRRRRKPRGEGGEGNAGNSDGGSSGED